MSETVGKEYLMTITGAALGLAHCLLGIGALMILFVVLAAIRQCFQRPPQKPSPLPTPPMSRRKPSSHTVYPPTPPVSRQQMSVFAICRPTPPESPLVSVTSSGGRKTRASLSGGGGGVYKPFFYLQEPRRCSLQLTPPHRNSIHNVAFSPDWRHHQSLRSTWSLPGSSYQLLES